MHFVLSDFSVPHIMWVAMFTFDDMPLTSVFISRWLFHYVVCAYCGGRRAFPAFPPLDLLTYIGLWLSLRVLLV